MRGQLSIDVLFAIIAVAIFFSVLVNTYNSRLDAQVQEQNSLNEAKAILLDAYSAIGSVKAYGQTVTYLSPIPKQRANISSLCTITKKNNPSNADLNVQSGGASAAYKGLDLSDIKFKTVALPVTEVQSFDCAKPITICKSSAPGC